MTQHELKELEIQLSRPDGEKGIEVAKMMNESNLGMTLESIKARAIESNNRILEIGHGNCAHLSVVFSQAENIKFFGLEISETMFREAQLINKELSALHKITFTLYDGNTIPFPENYFDRIMTVNTIYFWSNPIAFLNDAQRVLKPDGLVALAYAQKKFMEQLPFVKSKFTLYDNAEIEALINRSRCRLIGIIDKNENIKSKDGQLIRRDFSIATFTKERFY